MSSVVDWFFPLKDTNLSVRKTRARIGVAVTSSVLGPSVVAFVL